MHYKLEKEKLLQLLLVIPYDDEDNLKRQIENRTFWVALSSKKHDPTKLYFSLN